MRRLLTLLIAMASVCGLTSLAQEKITYQDHLLPIIQNNCGNCHNSDKKKGDLDLTSYSTLLAGGASGKIVVAGDPDASKIYKAISHLEEPEMPPKKPKLADKDIAVFKKWIAGGLLETLGGKAITSKPTVDWTLSAANVGKPDGPPPMPGDLLLEPVMATKRRGAVTGLASSPWAPVIAIAGQKQIVLYNSDTLEFAGILPFADGNEALQPCDVKFSRNGKLVIVGGGHAAKTGRVMVFDITTGEPVITVGAGEEFDSALAADISPDQSKIALGGPSRMLKVYSTKDGAVLFKMKKHTDWITALAFSPNGEWLASADRNGGISVWDVENGQEIYTLAGHKASVTAVSWRGDSKMLASVSEDGSLKIWEMQEGKQAKTWNAHNGGALSVNYTHNGRLVTCGRDNQMSAWNGDGNKLRSFTLTNELPVRATFSHDGARVIASDWSGGITVWNSADGKRVGELAANPPTIAERLVSARQRLSQLQSTDGAQTSNATAQTNNQSENIAVLQARISKLVAAEVYAKIYRAKENLAARKREQEKLLATGTDKPAIRKLAEQIANEEKDLLKRTADYERLKSAADSAPSAKQAKL